MKDPLEAKASIINVFLILAISSLCTSETISLTAFDPTRVLPSINPYIPNANSLPNQVPPNSNFVKGS